MKKRQDIACVIKDTKLVGIVTKYSLYRLLIHSETLDVSIEGAIITDVVTLYENENVYRSRNILVQHQIAHAVVVDKDHHVIGVLSRSNIFQALVAETQHVTKQLTSLMNNLQEIVLAVDLNLQMTTTNDAALKMMNKTEEDCLGQHIGILLPDLMINVQDVLRTNLLIEMCNIEINHVKYIGSFFPILAWGQITGVMIVLENVTKFEKIATELETTKRIEQTLDSALEAAYDGVVITDSSGKITKVNRGFLDLYHYRQTSEVIGKYLKDIAPEIPIEKSLEQRKQIEGEYINIQGKKTVVTQTPIYRHHENIGTIIKILFRQLDVWKDLFNHMDRLETEISYYRKELQRMSENSGAFSHIISTSPLINTLKNNAQIAAEGFSNILITGESGTGKELFADGIHSASGRQGRFIKINCAAIPTDLLESEFFGYEEGAFTGAKKGGKPGKFELADKGTLFLDEIGDMSLSLQAKLLRVLQEKEFERVGGTKTFRTDVRILAATNKDLPKMIREGSFREDLYYRINVIHLHIPPLNKRKEDIPFLCDYFINIFKSKHAKNIVGVSTEAIFMLQDYHWPGNIRELENVLERAFHFCRERWITPENIFLDSQNNIKTQKKLSTNKPQYRNQLNKTEKQLIIQALAETDGNRTRAAKSLGISRSSLYQKIKKHDIQETSQFE